MCSSGWTFLMQLRKVHPNCCVKWAVIFVNYFVTVCGSAAFLPACQSAVADQENCCFRAIVSRATTPPLSSDTLWEPCHMTNQVQNSAWLNVASVPKGWCDFPDVSSMLWVLKSL